MKEAGGIPFLIPHIPELAADMLDGLDGVLLTGGDDIALVYAVGVGGVTTHNMAFFQTRLHGRFV